MNKPVEWLPSDSQGLHSLHRSAVEWVRNAERACDSARDVASTCNQHIGMLLGGLANAVAADSPENYPSSATLELQRELQNLEFSEALLEGQLRRSREVLLQVDWALQELERTREPELVTYFQDEDDVFASEP